MKKLLTLLLILMLTLSMAACGGSDDTPEGDGSGTENNVIEGTEEGEEGDAADGSGEEESQSNEGGIGTGETVNPDDLIMGDDEYSDMEAEYDFKFDAADSFGLVSLIEKVDYSDISALAAVMEERLAAADSVYGSQFMGFADYEEIPEDDIDKLAYAIAMENDDVEGRYLETGAYHAQSTGKHYQYVMSATQNFYEVSSANTKTVVNDLEKAMGITVSEKRMQSAIETAIEQANETLDYFSLKDSASVKGKGFTENIKISVDAFATEENVIGYYVSAERERCYE